MRHAIAPFALVTGILLTITIQHTWRRLVASLLARGDT